jgi:quercetin dioxygenase-like cupin family protein
LEDQGVIGKLSERIAATGVIFRENAANYDYQWHNAPQRQYILLLSGGGAEVEIGDGSKRRFEAGDILLVEDTTGQGHITRSTSDEPRVSIFVTLD